MRPGGWYADIIVQADEFVLSEKKKPHIVAFMYLPLVQGDMKNRFAARGSAQGDARAQVCPGGGCGVKFFVAPANENPVACLYLRVVCWCGRGQGAVCRRQGCAGGGVCGPVFFAWQGWVRQGRGHEPHGFWRGGQLKNLIPADTEPPRLGDDVVVDGEGEVDMHTVVDKKNRNGALVT